MFFDFEEHEARMRRLEEKALKLGLSSDEAKEFRVIVSDLVKVRWIRLRQAAGRTQANAAMKYREVHPEPVYVEQPPLTEEERRELEVRACAMALFEHQSAIICDCDCPSRCDVNNRCPHLQKILAERQRAVAGV